MIDKQPGELQELVQSILLGAGADAAHAAVVAEHLVLANRSGVDTHGIWHLLGYVEAIMDGELDPAAAPEVLDESAAGARLRGHWTFGQVVAQRGMEMAIAKAANHGIAAVALVELHHIGRLGHYVETATAAGQLGMVFGGGYGEEQPATMPYGGRQPVLHTNPIAMGFPVDGDNSVMFDWATTALSGVKVVNAQRRRQPVPEGSIVDSDGRPTTDPDDFFAGGGHVPFGGHKGYCLMMAAEYLGRIFAGGDEFAAPERGGPILRHQGVTMIAMRSDLFQPQAVFAARAGEMQRRVRAVPPAVGTDRVLAPGDLEAEARAQRRETIPIEEDVWESVLKAAELAQVQV